MDTTPQMVQQSFTRKSMVPNVLLLILAIVLIAAASGVSYVLGLKQGPKMAMKSEMLPLTPTPTVAVVFPTPTVVVPTITGAPTFHKYTDTDIPFSVTYPLNWTLKKTYGKGIQKLAPTDVVSGIEIDSRSDLTFVVNVIDKKQATSLMDWWKTGSHPVLNISQPNFSFRGIDAVKVSETPGGNPPARVGDEVYFLWKGNIYMLSMQYTPYSIDTDLVAIYNTLQLPQ